MCTCGRQDRCSSRSRALLSCHWMGSPFGTRCWQLWVWPVFELFFVRVCVFVCSGCKLWSQMNFELWTWIHSDLPTSSETRAWSFSAALESKLPLKRPNFPGVRSLHTYSTSHILTRIRIMADYAAEIKVRSDGDSAKCRTTYPTVPTPKERQNWGQRRWRNGILYLVYRCTTYIAAERCFRLSKSDSPGCSIHIHIKSVDKVFRSWGL